MILFYLFLKTGITDLAKRIEATRHLVCLLPVPNRDTLEVLLKLLDKVRTNSSQNRMDAFNLAMVFGPNLLKKNKPSHAISKLGGDHSSDKYSLIDDIDSVISVTKYLIENHQFIFNVRQKIN